MSPAPFPENLSSEEPSSREPSSEQLPSEEAERLKALRRYDILDSPHEEQFDRIVRLAARWFDVPISLITLLAKERQWFKAQVGLDRRETAREASFCEHNVSSGKVFVVEDATEDPRFENNPLVTGPPGIRFYAGAPLVAPGGYVVGALCVIDTEPRDAGPMDFKPLEDMSAIVIDELELRLANKQIQGLVEALTSAEETERKRLSDLLHEDLQQVLQAVRMKLENLSRPGDLSGEHLEQVEDLKEWTEEAIRVTRGLSARFAPAIGNEPLPETFRWLTARMKEVYGLTVTFEVSGPADVPGETLNTLLYRAVREFLFNVVKHAGTDEARLSLTKEEGHLRVVVEDEGKGFVPDEKMEGGLGFTRVLNRIEGMGGTVDIISQPGVGTRVVIEVPPSSGSAA